MTLMPKLTYPDYSNSCGWNAMLPPRTPKPALAGDITVEYAVVGAGYTGFGAARRLHELDPQARIAVLEATTVGEGSSARNSGFTASDVLPRVATLEMAEKARKQTKLFTESFDWLMQIIAENGIDMATRAELVAASHDVEEIRRMVGATSLHYLTLEGLQASTGLPREYFCRACFDGDYPIEVPEELAMCKMRFEGGGAECVP